MKVQLFGDIHFVRTRHTEFAVSNEGQMRKEDKNLNLHIASPIAYLNQTHCVQLQLGFELISLAHHLFSVT